MLSILLSLLMLMSLLPTSLAEAVETTPTVAEVSDEPIVNLSHDPNGIPNVFYQGNTIVGPGNAVGIRGEYLDQEWTATITDGEKSAEVELIQQNRQSFKFVIPADFQANTIYTLSLDGEKPLSITLNKPVVQWMQGDEGAISTVGGWVRVQGECLTLDETKPHTLNLTAADGTVTTLNADRVYDAYSVGFVIPELPLGEYKAVYANGFGEDDAGILTIGVSPESTWGTKVYDVTKYKIDNTGVKDCTIMVNTLLGHIGNTGGGVLYFPAGRYLFSNSLDIPSGVVLRGDGMDETQLFWRNTARQIAQYVYEGEPYSDFQATGAGYMLNSLSGNFAVENMEFAAAHIGSFIYVKNSQNTSGYGNVRVENVRVNQNTYFGTEFGYHYNYWISLIDAVRSKGGNYTLGVIRGDNNKFINCEFNWSNWMSLTGGSKYTLIQNCTFESTGTNSPMGYATNYSIVEDNTWKESTLSVNFNNAYFARNTIEDAIHGDNREALTSDGTAGLPYQDGAEIHEDGVTFTFPDKIKAAEYVATRRPFLQIIEGTGAGQMRRIVAGEGVSTVKIEQPFEVAPDETSRFTISTMGCNAYLVDCTVDNGGMVQFYTGQYNSVIDGFKITRSAGIKLYAKKGSKYLGTSWYCSVVNCDFSKGNYYHTNGYMDYFHTTEASTRIPGNSYLAAVAHTGSEDPVYNMNTVFRNNTLDRNCVIYLFAGAPGTMLDPIVDGNHSSNTRCGIYVEGSLTNLLLNANTAENVDTPVDYYDYQYPKPHWGTFP